MVDLSYDYKRRERENKNGEHIKRDGGETKSNAHLCSLPAHPRTAQYAIVPSHAFLAGLIIRRGKCQA